MLTCPRLANPFRPQNRFALSASGLPLGDWKLFLSYLAGGPPAPPFCHR